MLKSCLLTLIILCISNAYAGWFVEGSLGVNNESASRPEVSFGDNFLATVAGGYAFHLNKNITLDLGFQHTSAPNIYERGNGINMPYVKIRHEWR